jgi:hypothetical protein
MIDYNSFISPYIKALVEESSRQSELSFLEFGLLDGGLHAVSLIFPFEVSEWIGGAIKLGFNGQKSAILPEAAAYEARTKLLELHYKYAAYHEARGKELLMYNEDIMDKAASLWKGLEEDSLQLCNKHRGHAIEVFTVACSYPFNINIDLISELIMYNSCVMNPNVPYNQLYVFSTIAEAEHYKNKLIDVYNIIEQNQYKSKKYWRVR